MKIKPTHDSGGVAIELGANEAQLPTNELPSAFRLRTVLVPVDFSDCSRKALEYAVPFARQFGATITLIHVLPAYVPIPEMTAHNSELSQKQLLRTAQADIKALQKTLPAEVMSGWMVREGDPAVEIVNAAKESSADLIIISTHGHTKLTRFLLGSTTERVVRLAGCPVLVVREREHEFLADNATNGGG